MAYVKHNFQPMDILHASEMNEIDEQVYQNSIQSYAKIVTQAEYDALSEAEKNSNVVYYISDAPFDSPNVVTLTRAEYDALSEADKMDGRFYYITDDAEVATSLVVQTNQDNPDTVPSSKVVYDETSAIRDALSNLDSYEIPSADRLIGVSVFLRKRNGMVTLQTNGSNTVAVPSGGGTTICTLPEAYRPPMQLSCWQNVNGNYKAYFSIYPNGTFLVGFSAIPTGQNFQTTFNYVTAS